VQAWVWTLLIGAPGAVAGGWYLATLPADIGAVATQRNPSAPQIDHAGLQARLARQTFVSLGMPTMVAVPNDTSAAVAGLSMTTPINEQLARDLTAIVGSGRSQRLIVVDRDQNEARREIRRGEEFRDGWTVKAIEAQAIILQRSDEEISVSLFGEAGAADPQAGEPEARPKRRNRRNPAPDQQ
jgi:hypothetical protein